MKRIKFEVIVTDNGVSITDRDRLFFNISATKSGMKENLQCDYDNNSFVCEMLTHSCNVIATEFEDLVSILEGNNEKPQPVVSKHDSLLFDRAKDYENSPTFEEIFEELRNSVRHHNMTPTSINELFLNRKNNKQ